MHYLNETIQRYLNGLATPAEIHELTLLATEHCVHLEEFILQHIEETFAEDFENSDTTQNEFSPQYFYDHRLSASLHDYRRKQKETKVISIRRGGRWLGVAAVVTAMLLVVGTAYYKKYYVASEQQITCPKTASTTFTGKQVVVLPDGSTAVINEGSKLSYTESFGHNSREVILSGEAFFDIQSDPSCKFIVHTGNVATAVLGTAFNVKAIANNVIVAVKRGKVVVASNQQELGTLTPNEQIIVDIQTATCLRTKLDNEQVATWTNKFIIISDQTMEDALAKIAERFNVNITLKNEALKNCRVYASFLEEPKLEKVLTVITSMVYASYSIKNGTVTITGGQCK